MEVKKNFFITGLPRSRTAWLAAYFTEGNVFCYHDGLKYLNSKEDFYDLMHNAHRDYRLEMIGNSDSGLIFTDFQTRFPGVPTVIIERPVADSWQSMVSLGFSIDVDFFFDNSQKLDDLTGLRVPYEHIDRDLRFICEYIGVRYSPARHALFKQWHIETEDLQAAQHALDIWRETA